MSREYSPAIYLDLRSLDKLRHNSFTPKSQAMCEFNRFFWRPRFFNGPGT